jgi:hypothetical protein
MLGDISKAQQICIACDYTDMRKSIDGLCAIVQQNFQMNPKLNRKFQRYHYFNEHGTTGMQQKNDPKSNRNNFRPFLFILRFDVFRH